MATGSKTAPDRTGFLSEALTKAAEFFPFLYHSVLDRRPRGRFLRRRHIDLRYACERIEGSRFKATKAAPK
jgi:hypothetical protein